MKIRIKGNSIRLRLTRPEVHTFGQDGVIAETTEFGDAVFHYVLKASAGEQISATFQDNTITVYMPDALQRKWVTSEDVGYSHDVETGNGGSLFVLIEKDFKCVDNTTEDQSDNFEHPSDTCAV